MEQEFRVIKQKCFLSKDMSVEDSQASLQGKSADGAEESTPTTQRADRDRLNIEPLYPLRQV